MVAQPKKSSLTAEEYLAVERKARFKSEFYKGEMFAMAGADKAHNLIVSNVLRVLGNQLLERDCNLYPSDMRVKVRQLDKYTYPDISVTCGEEIFEDDQVDTLLNPVLIIEVLSDSTEAYDRGMKFEHYQHIGALSEYLLIAQNSCRVEQYMRQHNKKWTYQEFHSLDDVVALKAIGCVLALKEIYFKTAKGGSFK